MPTGYLVQTKSKGRSEIQILGDEVSLFLAAKGIENVISSEIATLHVIFIAATKIPCDHSEVYVLSHEVVISYIYYHYSECFFLIMLNADTYVTI